MRRPLKPELCTAPAHPSLEITLRRSSAVFDWRSTKSPHAQKNRPWPALIVQDNITVSQKQKMCKSRTVTPLSTAQVQNKSCSLTFTKGAERSTMTPTNPQLYKGSNPTIKVLIKGTDTLYGCS